ncbi:LPXTG cell wall anchor domain-containing protein [Clostridium botulinum]|uniref:Gram-positive cocci surface proteins LPxTG domain-containing protein n=4 Tax=Clostridium botulinum TaxID=1491 RepID=A0A0A0IP49_CLOBO|nr:LPXTG cell wall anchor domain-containing protein [Clostridium botulinum]KGN01246.1 hypothetical protein Z955_01550 [Clostridium botulinum C/D str. DC5]KOC53989.1 hypothetical protein ADU89_08180 [Clostridium botulinum]KOC57840.1 hypothetical protein ADU90_03805 [Clostridium botulinum]MCD3232888.1 LPXTG cell wall anchor domain-containing protein [Clostridium botulinum D/C]MCD3238748.1 LPXTG cell wall anchor domain-containing protein [Clostridium botulinum D/C]
MLKNKKLIIITIAGLTLVGNMAIASKCFAYTSDKNLSANEHVLTTKQKYKDKKDKVKIKRKKRHKGHNKKYNEILKYEYEFEITKPPIRGIDFDNETIEPITDSYIDGTPVAENPLDFEAPKESIKEKEKNNKKEITVSPIIDPYIDGTSIVEKVPTVNPSDYDFEIVKAPIRGIDFDNETIEPITDPYIDGTPVAENPLDFETPKESIKEKEKNNKKEITVSPITDPYIDGTAIVEKVPTVNPSDYDFEIVKAPIRGIDFDNETINPITDSYIDGSPVGEGISIINPYIDEELIDEEIAKENGLLVKTIKNIYENKQMKEEKINLDINKNKDVAKVAVVKEMQKVNNLQADKKVLADNKKDINKINDTKELPKTGTNSFKTLLLGGALLIVGMAMSLFSRKKANE